jgi:DNA-binding NarL/FixJ family response regulator
MNRPAFDLEAIRAAATLPHHPGGVPHHLAVVVGAAVSPTSAVTVLPADGVTRVPVVIVEHRHPGSLSQFADLTEREREVAVLVAEGCTNRAIARRLSISEATVKDHVHRILAKSGAGNRTTVAAWWRARSAGA